MENVTLFSEICQRYTFKFMTTQMRAAERNESQQRHVAALLILRLFNDDFKAGLVLYL